jgi:predicted amidophosphoribosyltransferase
VLLASTCVGCGGSTGPVCPTCAAAVDPVGPLEVDGVDAAWALLAYEGVGRELVRGLKFTNRRGAVGVLSRAMAGLVAGAGAEVATWVPATPSHRRARGYDQAELLARRCAAALAVPARRLLVRTGDRSQTGLDRRQRLTGPDLRARRAVTGTVLLVDDVVTTGASLATAAGVLRSAGADGVVAVTLAARR